MAQILVAGFVHEAGRALLEARDDVDHEMLENISVAELDARIGNLDALIVRLTPLRAGTIAKATRLKVVSRYGVGYDSIDVAALTARGIPLTVVGDANAVTVAEHALGLMIAVTRRLVTCDRAVRDGRYGLRNEIEQTELYGKTVLIVGFGRVGRRVAKRCAAFEMKVLVADPFVAPGSVTDEGYDYVKDFREALPGADFVTLHMPADPQSSAIMAAAEFAAMKPGAYLINVARGSLVDEAALAAALTDGPLRGAGLDVTQREPPDPDNPLLRLDNVILTPHSAALTAECSRRMSLVSVQNALDGIDGQLDPALGVNRDVLESSS